MTRQEELLMKIDLQVKRLAADRESDKQTFRETHRDFEKRIRHLETHWARASGALIILSMAIQVILHFISP